jgi:Kef-type K+ transport system membrane component KefB
MVAEVLLGLALLLALAKGLGYITNKLGLSLLVGEMLAGIIAGPFLGIVKTNELLEFFATLGIMILVFIIGLETKLEDIKADIYTGSFLAFAGAALTFLVGFVIGDLYFKSFDIGLVLGAAMISTSTAIPLKILLDRGEYHTHTSRVLIVTSLADDIIAILSLSILISYFTLGSVHISYVAALFFIVLGFILVVLTVGDRVINSFMKTVKAVVRDENILFTASIIVIFVIVFLSQVSGLAAITGAFLAGMAMARSDLKDSIIVPKINTLGAFVIPLFFAYSATLMSLDAIINNWQLILIILAAGSLAKAFGSGYLSRYFKIDSHGQRIIAIGMIPRGEYGIVISQVALAAAIITQNVYTTLVTFILLTVIITPILFKLESRMSKSYSPKKG